MSLLHPLLVAADTGETAVPIRVAASGQALEGAAGRWAALNGFEGKAGQVLVVPDAEGGVDQVLVGAGAAFDPMSVRGCRRDFRAASTGWTSTRRRPARRPWPSF